MTATLTVYDETASGQRTGELSLDFLTERVTARELIRSRIYQEVQDYNTKRPDHFKGLVQPAEADEILGGYRLRKARRIDWKEQYQKAIEAFERNGFFIIVGDRQVESLEEEIVVEAGTKVSFVRLVPLVGG